MKKIKTHELFFLKKKTQKIRMNYKSPKIRKKNPEKNQKNCGSLFRKNPDFPHRLLHRQRRPATAKRQNRQRHRHLHLHLLPVRRHPKPQPRRLLALRQHSPAPKSASCSSPPARSTPAPETPNSRCHGTPRVLDGHRNHRTHGPGSPAASSASADEGGEVTDEGGEVCDLLSRFVFFLFGERDFSFVFSVEALQAYFLLLT
jgi:hypothetical protein